MGDDYNFQRLRNRILALSEAAEWEVARREWALVDVYEADELETCFAGISLLLRSVELRTV